MSDVLNEPAISLHNVQLSKLHAELAEEKHQRAELIKTAERNQRLFVVYANLVQALYQCRSLSEVQQALHSAFADKLAFPHVHLQLFLAPAAGVSVLPPAQLIEKRLKAADYYFGRLTQSENQQIFQHHQVGSVALVLLGRGKLGLLAIGSEKASHFQADMDTMYLEQIRLLLEQVISSLAHG